MTVPAGVQFHFEGNLYIEGQTVPKAGEDILAAALAAQSPQPQATPKSVPKSADTGA